MNTQFPLSLNQFDIYIDQMRWTDGSHLNIGAVVTIIGDFNINCFHDALNQVLRCHPGLRVRIDESEGQPCQIITEYENVQLNLVDFSDDEDSQELARKYIEDDFIQPFHVGIDSPLACFKLVSLSNRKHLWYSKFHHIITDGWGTSILFQEVIRIYNQIVNNDSYQEQAREFVLTDYLAEEAAYLQSQSFESDRTYWYDRLQGIYPQIFPEVTKPQLLGDRYSIYIPRQQYNRVAAICKDLQSNPFHFILSLLFIYLTKRYRQHDLVIGLPLLNRSKKKYKEAIGLFVSMLPFRLEIDNHETVAEILQKIRTLLRQDYRHQRFPLGEMNRIADLDTSSNQNLFEVTLSYEKHDYSESFTQTQTKCVPLYSGQQKTPLAVYVREFDEESDIKIDFDYNLAYFDGASITQLVTCFQKLFFEALENLDQQIYQLSLLSLDERQHFTPNALINADSSETLVIAFAEIVSKYPQKPAVKFENATLSYADINQKANRLAHYLHSLGVQAETRVGLCLERSENLIVAILGVLKAGGAYVPLDPNYPQSRQEFILEDSGVTLVITEDAFNSQFIDKEIKVLSLNSITDELIQQPNTSLKIWLHPQHPAYVIYTSGSTGNPKGCVVTHANVMRLMRSTEPWFGFNENDVWTMFHSFAFDFSVWELWGALLYGGKVIVVPFWLSRSPEAFRELLTQEKVTVLNQTPSAFRQLIRADATNIGKLALRYIIFGGEALDLASLRPWFERHGDKEPQLVNMYGITETTVHVTYRLITQADLTRNTGSVIGKVIPDLGIYLLDENLEPVPVGFPGEIFVAGAGVTRGYLHHPALTAARFIPNPFGEGRLYRSGDLAQWTSDGDLQYLGRIDHQVKIRGFRMELGEIQAALTSHPQVDEAFVSTYDDGDAGKRLVAYYVPRLPQPSIEELNQYLQSRLPNYMLPSAYISLDNLPLTVNGKINPKALPKPDGNLWREQKQYIPPRNAVEEGLCEIWSKVLGQAQVGIDDNFFAIGGDSILAMQVVAQAKNQQIPIAIKDIYENPTVRQLAMLKGEFSDDSPIVSLISAADSQLLPDNAEDAYPLSSLQAGMLYHSELHPGSAIFHDIFTFYLRLNYLEAAWRKALMDICQAHPVLRIAFDWTRYSTPLQVVYEQVELPLTVYDLRDQGENARQQVQEWVEREKACAFDVRHPPLWRFVIHRLTDTDISLSFSFHHAILDGWSVATLMTQLLQRYIRYVEGRETQALITAGISYKDFIIQEKQAIAHQQMRQFWQQYLDGMELSRIPRLAPVIMPEDSPRQVERLTIKLDKSLADGLRRVANSAGVPLKTALLAVHLRVLSLITGQSDVVTGNVLNGRPEQMGSENLLGLFLNTVPVRMQLTPGSWWELMQAVFATENEILPYRQFPLLEIQRLVDKRPLFEVGFNYVHFHVYAGVLNLPQIEVLQVDDFEETDFPFLVKFLLMPDSGDLKLDLIYDIHQFSRPQIQQYGQYYQAALSALALNPSADFHNQSLMSNEEVNQYLQAANQDVINYSCSDTLVSRFDQVVKNYPEKVAVSHNNTHLTFIQLASKVNSLAHYLQSQGVVPGTLVGLCMERSHDLIVAILAILQAGAAYVPIDPHYPAERINFIQNNSGISLLLTERATVSQISASATKIVILEDIASHLENQSSAPVEVKIQPHYPAYVIYTSGSTGTPKGCIVTHANVIRLLKATDQWFKFNCSDVWTLYHSYAFDFSVWEMWGALLYGGKVVVVPYWISRAPQEFLQLLQDEQVTVLNQTPSAFKQLVQAIEKQPRQLALRYVIFGGEALELQSLQPWFNCYGDQKPQLINMYGITETTVHVTYRPITQADVTKNRGSVIGKPIPDLSIYLLDEYLQPVPIGVTGELYIGGAGVTQGYLHHPRLSAERFIPHPFAETPGSRLYRSGDLARRLPDGELEYLGRSDHQVKIRGFRIELGEIASALTSHPQVQAAHVIAKDGKIIAYFVSDADEADLREFLKAKLPDYMLPTALLPVATIPLTSHGKVDQKALPIVNLQKTQSYIAPRNDLEAHICSLMATVLEIERVGITDDFWEIGGDSLKITQLVTHLRETHQVDLPLSQVLSHRTPQELAELITTSTAKTSNTTITKSHRNRKTVQLSNDGTLLKSL